MAVDLKIEIVSTPGAVVVASVVFDGHFQNDAMLRDTSPGVALIPTISAERRRGARVMRSSATFEK